MELKHNFMNIPMGGYQIAIYKHYLVGLRIAVHYQIGKPKNN